MAEKIICNAEDLVAIADAVRTSTGSTATYNVPELRTAAVNAIGNGGIAIDNTLTVSGKAADAKATGDRLTALSEEMVKSINGIKPDANGNITLPIYNGEGEVV